MAWWEIVLTWVCASPIVCVLASLFLAGAARASGATTPVADGTVAPVDDPAGQAPEPVFAASA